MPLDVELFVQALRPSPAAGGVPEVRIAPPREEAGPSIAGRSSEAVGTQPGDAASDGQDVAISEVLRILRANRRAESRMLARVRKSLDVGETDLLALMVLKEAQSSGEPVRQRELAHRIGISTAAVSALIDRLSRAGIAHRVPHPDDRRSVAVELCDDAGGHVRSTLADVRRGMRAALEAVPQRDLTGTATVLERLSRAMDHTLSD